MNSKELEVLAVEARKYKNVEKFVNNASRILKEITTNEIRSLTPSIEKDKAGRVTITRYYGHDIVLGVMVPWEKTTTHKGLAYGKREILKYLTDFYSRVTKRIEEVKPEIKPIPKELEPLAVEARKYKSAEEFEDSIKKFYKDRAKGLAGFTTKQFSYGETTYGIQTELQLEKAGFKNLKSFYVQATKSR